MAENSTETLRTVLEDAWDDGNAAGLDGWVGPGRGTEQVDDDAIFRRDRATKNALANLAGWRPPARVIATAEAIADEPTGTVVRSRTGDIVSVDHGPHADWLGHGTQVHFLGPGPSGSLSVGNLTDPDMAGSLPWTVLWQPEVSSNA